MQENLKPYPQYKESGLSWLRHVPEHWTQFPGFAVLSEKLVKNSGLKEKTVLSLSYGKIIVKPIEKLHGLVPDSFETYQIVKPGDIIIRSTDLQNDNVSLRVGEVKDVGIITSAYLCLRPKNGLNSRYAYLLLHGFDLLKVFYGLGSGLRQNLSWLDFKRLPFFIPPLEEQNQIARYLDWKTSQISKFIKAKKRMIELLKEQKQVIINDAVTGKIDVRTGKPYPKYKDSGVEWLGVVPEEWEVRKLKYFARSINNQASTKTSDEVYIALENVESWTGRINLPENEVLFESQVKRFQPNDILFGKLRPYLAKVTKPSFKGVCVGEFLVLRPMALKVLPDFIELKLRSFSTIDNINKSTFGAKMPRADWGFVGNMLFSIPSSLQDQDLIVQYINNRTASIDQAIKPLEQEIFLLKEYRTRLIADVVTGKVDVRDIAVPVNTNDNAIDASVEEECVAETDE